MFDIFFRWYRVTSPFPVPLRVHPIALYFIFHQYYGHRIMRQRRDVGRTDGIVSRGERGGTEVARRINWQQVPPPYRLGLADISNLIRHIYLGSYTS